MLRIREFLSYNNKLFLLKRDCLISNEINRDLLIKNVIPADGDNITG